ncbi:MAG TPA: FHA domain-containing protein [Thermoleophilaceae bacterium]|nr:FHA domain-containing protein [Thermoleophilaceae bacterium]
MTQVAQRPAWPVTGGELQAVVLAEREGAPLLLYRDGESALRFHTLSEDADRVTIGRRSSNDIALSWDSEASRLHAVLERIADEWTVADDGLSKNGTFVNGEAVRTRRRLAPGDTIFVGSTFLTFRCEARESGGQSSAGTVTPAHAGAASIQLTPTERQILVALCRPFRDGLGFGAPATNKAIADEVFLSVDAVKGHLTALFQKFGLSGLPQNQKRLHLVERALVSGLVAPRDL